MDLMEVDQFAYLTGELAGIGGSLKRRPEDFVVEEEPLYAASGKGTHLYLWVEKRKRLTTDVARLLAQHFGVGRNSVGYAGLKDKHAVTRQMFSVEHVDEGMVESFQDEHIRILWTERHGNKIKRGHLAGNRFEIKVREVEPTAAVRAKEILDRLLEVGAPNYAGEQRFGYRKNNHILGKYLIQRRWQDFLDEMLGRPQATEIERNQEARRAYDAGDYRKALEIWPTVHRFERQALGPLMRGAGAEQAIRNVDYSQRSLLLSAFQSSIYNQLLEKRIVAGQFDRMVVGDVAMKHVNLACFDVLDAEAEQTRCDVMEISPTGPMWGPKMKEAQGEVGVMEREALLETGVKEEELVVGDYVPIGSRRSLRMPIRNAEVSGGVDDFGAYVCLKFDLPRGSFATTVMREIMKNSNHLAMETD